MLHKDSHKQDPFGGTQLTDMPAWKLFNFLQRHPKTALAIGCVLFWSAVAGVLGLVKLILFTA